MAPRLLFGLPMHGIIEATSAICRRQGVDIDRTSARLTLLTVVEHLDRVLHPPELQALAEALPLALSILLRRGARDGRRHFEGDEVAVRAACEALGDAAGGALGDRLRGHVPDALLGRRTPTSPPPAYVDPMEVDTQRPPPFG